MSNPEQAAAPQADISQLAALVKQLIDQDRGDTAEITVERRPVKPPRAPLLPAWVKRASASTLALWPLFLILAGLVAATIVVVSPASPGWPFLDRLARILMLATVALLWDIWTRPHSQPQDLEGPAQGAAEYRRIYTVGIFVIAGCLAQ